MVAFGVQCAPCIQAGQVVFLDGDLGAGKTTLSRGLLKGWGHTGAVTSPTFTLLESYELPHAMIYHFDLYRMEQPEELEMIGARELFNADSICLIEWPERAAGFLPEADVSFTIEHLEEGRSIEISGRASAALETCINA